MKRVLMAVLFSAGVARLLAAGETKPAAEILQALSSATEKELREDILPFWLKHARDTERGGFFGQVEQDLTVRKDAARGALLTSRILWTYSAAYRRYKNPEYLEMARWACADLLTHFWDKESGGLFWSITADGKPLDAAKHIYGEVFGIYGLAEYFRATGDKVALDRAIEIYRLVEKHARDGANGGYFEEFTRDWKRLAPNARTIVGGAAPKSQNTHLHIMEAYTNLLRVWPDDKLRRDHRALIDVIMARVVNAKTHHLHLYLADDWVPRSEEISYGHDIEFSWLLPEAAEIAGDPALIARARAEAVAIADRVLAEGADPDGAIVNESGPKGLIDSNKDWWPQAEAVVGYLNAYQISGEPRFFAAAQKAWTFIDTRLVDHKGGEWYRATRRDGTPDTRSPKISMWKCPYHNGRACLETVERIEHLLKSAERSAH